MNTATFRIWRGEKSTGEFEDYSTEVSEGVGALGGRLFLLPHRQEARPPASE